MDNDTNRLSIKEFAVIGRKPRKSEYYDYTLETFSLIHEGPGPGTTGHRPRAPGLPWHSTWTGTSDARTHDSHPPSALWPGDP